MNGPEHFQKAERLLEVAREAVGMDVYSGVIAGAQVHATLAAAAAAVLDPEDTRARSAWQRVTRVPRPECEHDGCTAEQSVSWDPYCTEHKDDLKAES